MTPDSHRWAGRIGRAGYVARAAVYCLIAALALDAARRYDPHEPRGVIGALHELANRTGGRLLLGLLTVGLLAQVVWRAVQAVSDIERPHGRAPRWWTRIGWSLIGLFYASLFVRAVSFMLRLHSDGGAHKRSLVSRALAHPSGRMAAFGVGAGLFIAAVVELVKAWRGSFLDDFDRRRLSRARWRALSVVGRIGLAGRALVFAAAGVLLVRSAWRARADTIGTGDVLRHVMTGPFGQPLVAIIAVGLFAYAALLVGEAAWRSNVRAPER
ncbi:MAG: hypothetical protein JWM53_5981 [bacterium]|nr:hypothetical protein [bacterium]